VWFRSAAATYLPSGEYATASTSSGSSVALSTSSSNVTVSEAPLVNVNSKKRMCLSADPVTSPLWSGRSAML